MPAPARFARRPGIAPDRPVEGRRLHQRGNRGQAGLCAANHRAQSSPHPSLVEARVGGSRAMTPDLPTAYDQLTPEEAAQIDAVCDRFERAWKATNAGGPVPCLASFMEQPEGCARAVLHQELVALDRTCRLRYGVAEGPEEPGAAAEDSELLATHRLRHDSDVLAGLPMGWP